MSKRPVEEELQLQLANVERAPSLVHLLLLVSLAGLKGTVDGSHPLIRVLLHRDYARRLPVPVTASEPEIIGSAVRNRHGHASASCC